ncbi:MAG: 50S ribosomal protein L35 [Candidatus Doudnabacteria bacterium]|nr:50S ribosomal protein L35 [Candidatus Doudnabacteria bacterium]
MPKQKTNKRVAKTFWKTGSGKLMRRRSGQAHFNSRESGKVTKNKRRDLVMHKTNLKLGELMRG